MREALRELLRSRELLYMITWREIRIRYKQSVMGLLWAVLMPIIITGAGVMVRVVASKVSGHPDHGGRHRWNRRQSIAVGVLRFRSQVRDNEPDGQQQPGHQDQIPAPGLSVVVGADFTL